MQNNYYYYFLNMTGITHAGLSMPSSPSLYIFMSQVRNQSYPKAAGLTRACRGKGGRLASLAGFFSSFYPEHIL